MADLSKLRRTRADLELRRTTLAARVKSEEQAAELARRRADAKAAAAAEARLRALREESAATAGRLRATERQATAVLTDIAIAPPAPGTATPTPAPGTTPTMPAVDLLGPVPSAVPLVLLPVRLEVRFRGDAPARQLLIRVYPDDIHIDTHEPGLTAEEREAGRHYWKQAWTGNGDADAAAWNQLAGMFGAERAAWIARRLTPTNLTARPRSAPAFPEVDERASSWTRAPRTNVLPDQWIASGFVGERRVFSVVGNPIPDILPVGPEPESEEKKPKDPTALPLDEGMRWLIDFDAAVAVGMALRVPLPADAQEGLSRLIVCGAKRSFDLEEAAPALAGLLDAHRFTRGTGFIAPGTPTNNTSDTLSGLDSRDTAHTRSFAAERGEPLFRPGASADGEHAAQALGLEPAVFQHLERAGDNHQRRARAMNTLLWPSTWGYYLEQRLAGVVDDADLRRIRSHFIDHVRAEGPLPSLRIGTQPYGFLPVTPLDRWAPADADDPAQRTFEVLRAMRDTFRRAVVPRINDAATTEQDLLSVLRMRPQSKDHRVRHVLGPLFLSNFMQFAGSGLSQSWWAAHQSIVSAPAIGGITPTMPQSLASLSPDTEPLSAAPRVAAPDAIPEYLTRLAGAGYKAALEFADAPPEPRPMLYLLSRHSLLLAYRQAAFRILARNGAFPAGAHLEPELPGVNPGQNEETLWQRLAKPVDGVTGTRTLGDFLDDPAHENDPDVRELGELRAALRELAGAPVADLERMLLGTLDLATHRFDAWATSLATRRLAALRRTRDHGVQLGGYGWLEDVRPATTAVSNGFVHVPSLEHAATAAVLASGYLSHRNSSGPSPFAIDLSSDRVRHARWLLQGVRAGQTLGALLGYRIERGFAESGLSDYIDELRRRFAPNGVIDGERLLEDRRTKSQRYTELMAAVDAGADRTAVESVFSAADRELDALGDLLIAESVFQTTRGNLDRAGQTLGSVLNGQLLPEPEVMDTPRTGVVVTHRIVTLLKAKVRASTAATASPRARAEPRLNDWLEEILGNRRHVRARVEHRFDDRTVVRDIAVNTLPLAAIDLVATPDEPLEALLLEHARETRPAKVPEHAEVRLLRERDPAWKADILGWPEFLLLVAAARSWVATMRPLVGADLGPAHHRDVSTLDLAELRKRADAAVAALEAAAEATAPASALADFGITSTATGAVAEARDRLKRVVQADQSFDRASASPARHLEHDSERIRTVFAATFPILPLVKLGTAAELSAAFEASTTLQDGDTLAATAWLERVAHVRPSLARMQDVFRLATTTHLPEPESAVAQLPFVAGERWVALPAPAGSMPTGKLSLVASGDLPDLAGPFCGVVLDDWSEMIPNERETTGVVFQFDRPAARPPQACLLAIAPDLAKPWDSDTLEATVRDALELARLRLVDQDALTELDQFLPATQFALNAVHDTVSTDFRTPRPS